MSLIFRAKHINNVSRLLSLRSTFLQNISISVTLRCTQKFFKMQKHVSIFNSPLSKNDWKSLQYVMKIIILISYLKEIDYQKLFSYNSCGLHLLLHFMFNIKHHKRHITYLTCTKYIYHKFTEAIHDKPLNVNS